MMETRHGRRKPSQKIKKREEVAGWVGEQNRGGQSHPDEVDESQPPSPVLAPLPWGPQPVSVVRLPFLPELMQIITFFFCCAPSPQTIHHTTPHRTLRPHLEA